MKEQPYRAKELKKRDIKHLEFLKEKANQSSNLEPTRMKSQIKLENTSNMSDVVTIERDVERMEM